MLHNQVFENPVDSQPYCLKCGRNVHGIDPCVCSDLQAYFAEFPMSTETDWPLWVQDFYNEWMSDLGLHQDDDRPEIEERFVMAFGGAR